MKLGLLGYPLNHSLSPELYRELLGSQLTSYELFSFEEDHLIPPLSFFNQHLDGLNITSPYKRHFVHEIEIPSALVKSVGAVNTLAFISGKTFGTNTDLLAVVEILTNYLQNHPSLHILLLGDGVMARVIELAAQDLGISVRQFSRKLTPHFEQLDLRPFHQSDSQTLVINACSRQYVFHGLTHGDEIFWDLNYAFIPHQKTLPSRVNSYHDGREMLELQARAALKFWAQYKA
jgi:shikimate dehydrogenase